MSADTQLPRWEVFKQDAPGKAHAAVGSVHAAGAEHALLMARTVFARRPSAASMWLAPAAAVTTFTREQAAHAQTAPAEPSGAARRYLVFHKTSDRRSMVACEHVGEVTATSVADALRQALAMRGEAPLATWLVEAEALVESDAADADAWFGPAKEKRYKQQSEYAVPVRHHEARRAGEERA